MSKRIQGRLGTSLAQTFDLVEGRADVNLLLDTDGVNLVYDLARLAEAEQYVQDTRGFDTGAIAENIISSTPVTGLPPLLQLWGIDVTTDDATRLSGVTVGIKNVGAADAGPVRDHVVWQWRNGDPTMPRPAGYRFGDGLLATYLLAPVAKQFWTPGQTFILQNSPNRQGAQEFDFTVDSAAFGAGTVQVTGHILLGFGRALGGRAITQRGL